MCLFLKKNQGPMFFSNSMSIPECGDIDIEFVSGTKKQELYKKERN